jgi:hypothetical protein
MAKLTNTEILEIKTKFLSVIEEIRDKEIADKSFLVFNENTGRFRFAVATRYKDGSVGVRSDINGA